MVAQRMMIVQTLGRDLRPGVDKNAPAGRDRRALDPAARGEVRGCRTAADERGRPFSISRNQAKRARGAIDAGARKAILHLAPPCDRRRHVPIESPFIDALA
jgi:hypothetical protein